MPIPTRLIAGHLCPDCRGTGADLRRTMERDRREPSSTGYVMCRACCGNGLDPAEYFRWSSHNSREEVYFGEN